MITSGSALVLLGILTLLFGVIWYTFYSDGIVLPFYRRGNWVVIGIYAAVLTLFFKVYGGFKIGYLRRTDVFLSQNLGLLGSNVIAYLQISLIARDFVAVPPILLLTVLEVIVLIAWTFLTGKLYFMLYPPRHLVIVYGSPTAAALVMKMSYRVDKYMICESISADAPYRDIIRKIEQYDGVIICDIPAQLRNDLVKFCFDRQLRAYIAPKISDIILRGADDIRLFDTPLLLCRNHGLSFEQRLVKRTFDIVFCLLALIPAAPIMLGCALAVKLCDGGPIFYKQKRLTEGGRLFDVYKFRSMIPDAEADGAQVSSDHDERVTKVGRFLRKCRLDELPQIFNILKGDMSVVGPRPERPEFCREYEKQFPEFRFRLHVRAGLTGYAQVTGAYDTTPYDKLKMDLMYIESWSLFRDIQIVLMTLKIMLSPVKSNESLLQLKKEAQDAGEEA
ncbi:MAG: exopolysaccharide biosynthesis polyprenyl glycosylphosphotransferase [Oscillospiraceae bacterium]|nr:exopolysaccharide biosynthesis polyprenyl glycosylphosphotransferase [Oscillospiraceae bacterium]MBQ7013788.1 exopolysaccharide biosynthesis polyprenyl glycosylphosphotransferase [Oscillospiraceae bacterium]